MKKNKPLKAWSYSVLSGYETCPRQHKFRKIEKRKEPKSPAMLRGIKIHNSAAKFLEGSTDFLSGDFSGFRDQFHELKALNPVVEQKWAFTEQWKPCTWMAKDVKIRVVLDALKIYSDDTADVIDHKTGKYYPDNTTYKDQMALFAASTMKLHPYVKHATARLWYLDTGDEVIMEFSKAEAMDRLADLEERAEVMLADTEFAPRPNMFCKWCHWNKSKGGPCEYGG